MVPPKFYLPADPEEMARKFKKYTGKQPQAPKHEKKLRKLERKRERLDPDQQLSKEDLEQQRLIAANAEEDNDDEEEEDEEEQEEEEEQESSRKRCRLGGGSTNKRQARPSNEVAPQLGKDGQALSVDGLKQRLTEKLQQLRSGRGGAPKTPAQRAADNRGKERQPKHVAGGMNKASRVRTDAAAAEGGAGRAEAELPRAGSSAIEFNKLAAAAADGASKAKRKLSTAALLAQAEEAERRRRARLSAPDGGGEDIQIEEWQRALQKAGGIKLKDNPALLKKALKRQDRKKKKSAQEWSSRIKTVAKTMMERQEKRRQNLKERLTKNKTRQAKNKASRAGFEGKKSSLLS